MSTPHKPRKESEIQAAEGPPDPELDSLIAPQGYDPELVDDVATMETPAEQRRKAIKFMVGMFVLMAIGFWFCTPADLEVPELPSAPYNIHQRPLPPADKFLKDAIPKTAGNLKLVDLKEEQIFEAPFIGEVVLQATYVDSAGSPVTVVMFEADSYINARRYLENYKNLLQERTTLAEWQERLYIEDNFIRWSAPDYADKAHGLAWNNDHYFIAVTSPISAALQDLASNFPY